EAYKGPSLIIAYSPCINHGINMMKSQIEMRKAVDCGYWQLFRYNPQLAGTDTNPLILDSKDPTEDYKTFLMGETRYASLTNLHPELAAELFAKNENDAAKKREYYKRRAGK
ncbi:MAG TPA: pyruvate synthase, partial [Eubacteriales bacterium]|nr:pyruvate synthase [Eubacteriales bacterium]